MNEQYTKTFKKFVQWSEWDEFWLSKKDCKDNYASVECHEKGFLVELGNFSEKG